jgi:hypothetical protein
VPIESMEERQCIYRGRWQYMRSKSASSSPSRSPSIDGSQNGLPSLRYFGLPPTQPLRLALVDPTDRILKGVEARSVVPAV